MTHISTNWHRQEFAIAALAGGSTTNEAAEAAGVSLRTIMRWRTDKDFAARLSEEAKKAVAETRTLYQMALPRAVRTLASLLDSPTETVRLRAAAALLRQTIVSPTATDVDADAHGQRVWKNKVVIVPGEHMAIVSAALEQVAIPGDPFIIMPEEDRMTAEEIGERGPSLQA